VRRLLGWSTPAHA
jgi:hypothetical protein